MYLEYSQRYSKASKDLQVLFGCIVTLVFSFLRSLGEGCCFIVCVPQYYSTSVIYTRQSQEKVRLGFQIFFSCFMNSLHPYYMSVFIPKNAGRGTKLSIKCIPESFMQILAVSNIQEVHWCLKIKEYTPQPHGSQFQQCKAFRCCKPCNF